MGRSPCCDKVGLKKGPWTPEEDQKLLAYIDEHGHGSWRALPTKAGLQRCGKSCRLRWTNYLRPDIKRGKFSLQEEQTIIQLHALLGNRWSAIATHLPKRTDNEIKNYWNTHLKKRLDKMGIDPVTHKPKNDALLINNGQSKNAANLSHMAQWESARLEAEARLVRESKLRSYSNNINFQNQHNYHAVLQPLSKTAWSSATNQQNGMEFVGTTSCSSDLIKDEGGDQHDWKGIGSSSTNEEYKGEIENSLSFTSNIHDFSMSIDNIGNLNNIDNTNNNNGLIEEEEGFTNLLLSDSIDRSLSETNGKHSDNSCGSDYYEDNKNYWDSILNLVNSSPSNSSMF